MKSRMKFKNLYAEYNDTNGVIFGGGDYDFIDCHESCVLMHTINFYGIPETFSDDQIIRIYEGSKKNLVKVADIKGCLILTSEMNMRGEDPLVICDDIDVDLGYAMSVLSDSGAPLDFVEGDPDMNVYYIREVEMVSEFRKDKKLKSQILQELPEIVFALLHATPDLVVYYPAHHKKIKKAAIDQRYTALKNIENQKTQAVINKIFSFEEDDDVEPFGGNNVISFGESYRFSEDELELLYQYDGEPPYPEEEKDKDEFKLYEMNGFVEIGESRLLCLEVE